MGEVYRALDTRLGREVAIKVLPEEGRTDPESSRRFEREARAVAALSHPHVVALFDVGEQDGVRYVVTELVEGETLRRRLADGPLPPAEAAEIGAQIAQGLAAAHEKGLVHRDLKPENVILTAAGTVKILDFGLARRASRPGLEADQEPTQSAALSEVGTIAGTAGYMSPEQVRGESLDARSDVFSLGTVLYEMLTGRRAFRAGSTVETLNAILKEEPAALPPGARVPEELSEILGRCLAKRRENRYHSAADLAHDLRAGRVTAPALRGPTSEMRRAPKWVLALGITLPLAIAAAGFWLTRRGPPKASPLRTLAVLPFRSIGAESEGGFGLGLADALIGRLATLKELTVRPTSAISRYEAPPADAISAGEQLGVEAVLEGTLQKLEGVTRVSLQLTDVSRRAIVWSDQLELRAGRLFEVQDEIARRVVERLRLELDPAEKQTLHGAQPIPDDVMEQYLAARARLPEVIRMPREAGRELVSRLDRILERVPNFARAMGARSYARAWVNFQTPSPGGHEAALADAERALALNPDLAEPRVARAVLYWSSEGGWKVADAIRELKAAIARNPGSEIAHLDLTRILYHTGWLGEARAALEPALRLNPSSPEAIRHAGFIAWMSGDLRGGLAEHRRLAPEIQRHAVGGRWQILHIRLLLEDPRRLLAEAEAWVAERPPETRLPQALLALARVRNGLMDISDLEEKIASADRQIGHFHHVDHLLAEAHAQKGNAVRAVEYLRRAAASGLNCLRCFETDPLIAPIRGTAEYAALKTEMAERDRAYRAALKDVL